LSDHRVNERIRAREVRLIDPDGKQLGVKPLPEALAIARQLDLDLVEVAPDANPPVCRIMDYNRFKYESAQRAKESRKKATSTSIKEMKYRPKIGTGDFTTKTRQVARFLEEGHKVKVTIMFRGREVSHPELGMKILDDLAEQVSSVAKVEAAPKLDGRNMVMVLAPDRRARQATRRATDLTQGTGAPSIEPEPGAPEPGAPEPTAAVPAGPGAADGVPSASAPPGAPSTGAPSTDAPSTDAPSTGTPSTGAPERVEAPVGSANGTGPPARQPATVAASAPSASRTPEGNLASHSS
jgi:translation initiation factor IF-3